MFGRLRAARESVHFAATRTAEGTGAHLARREVTILLRELFTRVPGIHAAAEPVRQRASFINGITRLPCSF